MTETTVEQGLDIESIEHLDFEFEEPCDYNRLYGSGCDKAAEWRIRLTCCAAVVLFCQEHWDNSLEAIADGKKILCNFCKAIHDPGSGAIHSAERLDKHSNV